MASLTTSALLVFPFLLLAAVGEAATFDVINQCSYTVWAASVPAGGGQQLNPGQTWTINVPAGTSAARIWARTGCSFDGSGRGSCQTGDCGGVLVCTGYGQPPNTLAEFTLNGFSNLDYFDISLVDGFNVPMDFLPTSGGCSSGPHCLGNNKPQCPDAFFTPTDGKVFTCPGGTNYEVVFCPSS